MDITKFASRSGRFITDLGNEVNVVGETGGLITTLTGSNATQITIFNALAITDTVQRFYVPTAAEIALFAKAKEIQLLYTNTLNQSLALSMDNDNISILIHAGASPSISIPASGSAFFRYLITKDEWSTLKARFWNPTKIAVSASVAPTSGNFTLVASLIFS